MIEALLHANVRRDSDGVYHATVRTQAMADKLVKMCEERNLKAVVEVRKAPRYFSSKEELLEYWIQTHPGFKEFHDELGLTTQL